MKTAVIYARYSCDGQSEQSIEGQLRVCKQYAEQNDIAIVDTYIDRAMTGTNDNRPAFQRMIKESSLKEWDFVLVYKLDRFSRNKYETAIHKKTLRDNGVKVLSAMENIPDTPEGIILESLLEGMNQYYSMELSQKVKRGMYETRRKGLYQGGGLLYGYKIDGRKIVIDDECAEVVRFMYEQYSTGVYVPNVIATLTEKGILYKGRPFDSKTVYRILSNEKYLGKYNHGDEIVDNMYPQIVPEELFRKVRVIVDKNRYGKRSIKVDYLLRHKLRCGYCGNSIYADSGKGKQGQEYHYYKCTGRKKGESGCTKSIVRKDALENIVIDAIIEELSKPQIMQTIVNALISAQQNQMTNNSVLKILQKEKDKIDNALKNIMTAIENGIISKTTNERLQELEKQQEQIKREILLERNKDISIVSEEKIREFYQQALRQEPQLMINYLVKEIVLYDDRMDIYFNSPLNESPETNRDFLICTKNAKLDSSEMLVFLKI